MATVMNKRNVLGIKVENRKPTYVENLVS